MQRQTDDGDRRTAEFMTALAARDVDAANIRGDGRDVTADIPDEGDGIERADSVADEFGYTRTGATYHDARDKDRTAVTFESEDN